MNDLSQAAEQAVAHAARLSLYARQWLDAGLAQDVVQEALVALLSQRRPPDDPVAWMYTTVRHAAIDCVRSSGRRRRREQVAAQARHEWFEPAADIGIDAQTAQAALQKLPPELREIVVLRIWSDLGYAQIAQIAQVSVGTAHQRFAAAIAQLRAALSG